MGVSCKSILFHAAENEVQICQMSWNTFTYGGVLIIRKKV